MTDLDAWYVCNRVVQQEPPQPDREGSLYLYVQPGTALMDAGQWVYVGLGTETLTAARGRLRDSFYSACESGFKSMQAFGMMTGDAGRRKEGVLIASD